MVIEHRKYILSFAALFIPYVLLCFYAYPVADDFHYTLWAARGGYWQFQLHDFFHWNGRYASNPLVMLDPIKTGSITGYQLVALGLIICTPLSFYFLLSSLFSGVLSTSQRILGSIIFSVLYFGIMPDLPEGLYWMTGSVTYHFGDLLAILYIGLITRYFQNRFFINSFLHIVLSMLMLFVVLGFNEILTLVLILAHAFTFVALRKYKQFRTALIGLSIGSILFSLIMILAPGNAERSGYFTNNHQIIHSLYMTGLQIIRFSAKWICFPPLLLASILFIPVGQMLRKKSLIFRKLTDIKLWQLVLALATSLFLSVFPAYWGTGILGQHRTLNTGCFFFIIIWFMFILNVAQQFKLAERIQLINGKISNLLIFLFAGCLLLSGNSGKAIMEFSKGDITGFGNDMKERFMIIQTAKEKGLREVSIPLLHHKPSSLFVLDIQTDCNHWINRDYAIYFNVDKVCMDTLK